MKGAIYSALVIGGIAIVLYNWKAIQNSHINQRAAKASYKNYKKSQQAVI